MFTTFPTAEEVRKRTMKNLIKSVDAFLNTIVTKALNEAIENKSTSFEVCTYTESEEVINEIIVRLVLMGYHVERRQKGFTDARMEDYTRTVLEISFAE